MGEKGDSVPLWLGGRGVAPPVHCGGPTGYCLMVKRQTQGGTLLSTLAERSRLGRGGATGDYTPSGYNEACLLLRSRPRSRTCAPGG